MLIIDELGFVPLSKTGAELLFELVSQRYERAAVLITSNLPFDEWTETFGSERLTGALLDRLTHHVPYPGNERRELPPQPQPREENGPPRADRRAILSRKLRSGYALPAFPAPAASSRIPAPSDHLTPTVAVAVFCSALWSGFSPPLTEGRGSCRLGPCESLLHQLTTPWSVMDARTCSSRSA